MNRLISLRGRTTKAALTNVLMGRTMVALGCNDASCMKA